MKFVTIKCLFHIFLLLLLVKAGYSQSGGQIKGKIMIDEGPAVYTSVTLAGTRFGSKTDEQGFFQILNIPAGTYRIVFSAIGYQQQEQNITVQSNEPLILNSRLSKSDSSLSEVIVTGVSRATQLRKNPVPVAVLMKKTMDRNNNNNLIDAVVKAVPGVSAVTTGPNISKPFIRGLGYNRVLTLYDGLRQEGQQWGDEHGIEIDQYGISRVEVIKGPASLSYGSDALAGVINMIPSMPDFEEGKIGGDFTADYHTNNGMEGTSLGLGYRKNDWIYEFRTTVRRAYSYTNKIDGAVYGTAFREYNLSAAARINRSWGYSKISATLYDDEQEIPDGSRDSLSRRFTRQVLDEGDDLKNRPLVPENELQSYHISPLHQHIQHYRIYSNSHLKIAAGSLDILLGGQQSIRREYNHPVLAQQAGLYVILNTLNYDLQ